MQTRMVQHDFPGIVGDDSVLRLDGRSFRAGEC